MNNLEKYIHIATMMNTFEVGEKVTIGMLAKRADVHYMTAKKAITFFQWCQKNITFRIDPDLAHAIKNKRPFERIKMVKKHINGEKE